jgi:hypothetical protein
LTYSELVKGTRTELEPVAGLAHVVSFAAGRGEAGSAGVAAGTFRGGGSRLDTAKAFPKLVLGAVELCVGGGEVLELFV